MKLDTEVAVIGAGPHGLASAVHLRRAGVRTQVLGEPMGFWRSMPRGMRLRSNFSATNLIELSGPFSLNSYMDEIGERFGHPFSLRRFVDYGLWVQRNAVPDVDTRSVVRLARRDGGFHLELADGTHLQAGRIVVACGIAPFANLPEGFGHLPAELVSHTGDHEDLSVFAGRRVLVVGGGQSALESAVLMAERGVEVEVAVRREEMVWLRSWSPIHFLGPVGHIVYAPTDVGPLWYSRLVATPELFKLLPRETQDRIAYRSIRPAGSYFVKVRFDGIGLSLGTSVRSAEPTGGALRVTLSDGSTREVDHLMFGTGYRVDVARYAFLSAEILAALRIEAGYPLLRRGLESSVPGLHFVGAPAARSFGPTMRFISGSWYAGSRVARAIGPAPSPSRARARVQRLARVARVVAQDPVVGADRIREKLADEGERFQRRPTTSPDPEWEAKLHAWLGISAGAEPAQDFNSLWEQIRGSLDEAGLTIGRGSFSGWDDGDPGLLRAAWSIARFGHPRVVVETGVARGLTTRVVLEALEANGDAGHLWSIDLKPPLDAQRLANETGAAVTDGLRARWTLVEGSSRQRLPGLLDQLATIDLFIHDSRHTHRNITFELHHAWRALRPGGFMVVDDIHGNTAFEECVGAFGDPPAVVCPSDDGRGQFGLIAKPA